MKEMTPLEELRHSTSHVLATAVLRLLGFTTILTSTMPLPLRTWPA
jgi:threonyl-tRNA synthetase